MKLMELLKDIPVLESTADMQMEITHIAYDSRKVQPGGMFVAVAGFATDGNRFIPMAMEKGAAALASAKAADLPMDHAPEAFASLLTVSFVCSLPSVLPPFCCNLCIGFVKIAATLCLNLVDFLIYCVIFQQRFMCVKPCNSAMFQHQNTICMFNTGNTLCNDNLGSTGNRFGQGFTNSAIGSCIHSTGGVIQDQHFRIFQKRSGNAQPLFLPT